MSSEYTHFVLSSIPQLIALENALQANTRSFREKIRRCHNTAEEQPYIKCGEILRVIE